MRQAGLFEKAMAMLATVALFKSNRMVSVSNRCIASTCLAVKGSSVLMRSMRTSKRETSCWCPTVPDTRSSCSAFLVLSRDDRIDAAARPSDMGFRRLALEVTDVVRADEEGGGMLERTDCESLGSSNSRALRFPETADDTVRVVVLVPCAELAPSSPGLSSSIGMGWTKWVV